MKEIKQLGPNKWGISAKEIKYFPSQEYGEEGGLEAKFYYHGIFIGTLFDAGDGGEPSFNKNEKISKSQMEAFWINVRNSIPNSHYDKTLKDLTKNANPETTKEIKKYFAEQKNKISGSETDLCILIDEGLLKENLEVSKEKKMFYLGIAGYNDSVADVLKVRANSLEEAKEKYLKNIEIKEVDLEEEDIGIDEENIEELEEGPEL